MSEKVLLVDGSSLAYRAFFALGKQANRFINHEGLHTNAVYSFKLMLDQLLSQEADSTYFLVAFDKGKETFRHKVYADYKAGRNKTPQEFLEQLPYIRQLIQAYGGSGYDLALYEADDIIGTLAHEAEEAGLETVIYSGDRDLTQLASAHTTVKLTKKGVSDLEVYTPTYIEEKYGLCPKQIIDMKGLAGDSSDHIPGVRKVGEKTALKLLHQYGSVENLYAHIDELKASKMKENLIADEKQALLSKELATINCAAPIDIHLVDIRRQPVDEVALRALYEKLDFKHFLNQFQGEQVQELAPISYTAVSEVRPEYFSSNQVLILEILKENYHTEAIIGCAWGNDQEIYVAEPEILEDPAMKAWIKNGHKIVFDAKKTWVLAQRYGVELSRDVDDVLLGSYLLDTLNNNSDCHCLAELYEVSPVDSDEEVYGKGVKQAVPEKEKLDQHLARKVKALYEMTTKMRNDLEEREQLSLYEEIEIPLSFVLAEMEYRGIKIDVPCLKNLEVEFGDRLQILEEDIYQQAGEKFNLNSPKQLGHILFEVLGLPVLKKTKTGYSTAVDVLEKLEKDYPIVSSILEYRQLSKLQSTYVTGLLKQIHSDGKVHTRYMQTLTQTGRLSSVDPNLQNIPVREEGKLIRKAFIPNQEDWLILASDYSQIELRVLAAVCGDENLQEAFKEGQDIHDSTARRIFHLTPEDQVTPEMRRQAKAVNFGVVYGISDYGLSENLGISRKEAKQFIDNYFIHYPKVKTYMEDIVAKAKEQGYVETLFHRRRYLPDLHSRNFNIRSFAERTAINTPIQGSAADILKIAMNHMATELKKSGYRAHLLLQVHDEVVLEVHRSDLEKVRALVEDTMDHAVELAVPLVTDSSFGPTWYDAK